MHLLFLNRSFWPDLEASGQNLTELCEDLSAEHDITVIAGPSYYVHTRHSGLWTNDRLGKIRILRTWGTRFSKRRLVTRMTNLGTYFLLASIAALSIAKPDMIIAATDPPLLGALGVLLKRWWRCPLVYNIRDLYPDVAEANGAIRNPLLLGLLKWSNALASARADMLVVLADDMRQRVIARGVPEYKVAIVHNNVDCRKIYAIEPNAFRARWADNFVVMYSGNLGLSQQLETVLEAADLLREDTRIVFLLVGEGARKNWLKEKARNLKLTNVEFLSYQPKERLAESLSAADLHLIPLLKAATGAIVPSKIYGILAVGRPFVAMTADSAEAARLAREYAIGFVVTPGDAADLARVVRSSADNRANLQVMGQNARQLALQEYDRPIIARKFNAIINSVGRSASHKSMRETPARPVAG
jgi:glycosyltransferase involved in cell wall biosynthesis